MSELFYWWTNFLFLIISSCHGSGNRVQITATTTSRVTTDQTAAAHLDHLQSPVEPPLAFPRLLPDTVSELKFSWWLLRSLLINTAELLNDTVSYNVSVRCRYFLSASTLLAARQEGLSACGKQILHQQSTRVVPWETLGGDDLIKSCFQNN